MRYNGLNQFHFSAKKYRKIICYNLKLARLSAITLMASIYSPPVFLFLLFGVRQNTFSILNDRQN